MSVEHFLDYNFLIYSFEDTAPKKPHMAQELIADALGHGNGSISWQVVQEFLNIALHQWEVPLNPADASTYLSKTLEQKL